LNLLARTTDCITKYFHVAVAAATAFINEVAGADRGLICAYQLSATKKPREISADSIVESLARHDVVTWLHFQSFPMLGRDAGCSTHVCVQ